MSTEIATVSPPAKPPSELKKKRPLKVTGKLRDAIHLMVFGQPDDQNQRALSFVEAARAVNMNAAAMRKALERPHVRAYLNEQKQVFRESASARNISRAIELRDQDENKTAAIQAMRYLDGEGSSKAGVNVSVTNVMPGVVIDLRDDPKREPMLADQTLIEVNPLRSQDAVGNEPFPTSGETADG